MGMPTLTIGNRTSRLPIIQGGMAVRVSLEPLAVAVAEAGGIGVIALSGMNPEEARLRVRRARVSTDGVLAVNVMVASNKFKELVQAAIAEGIDIVIAGAGFSRDVFGWGHEAGVPVVPVLDDPKFAKFAVKKLGASAVIVEGVEAGGHLGTDKALFELLPQMLEAVDVPVIGAGNIVTGEDIKKVLDTGAVGVQMGTRFAVTVESSASNAMKQLWLNSEGTVLVKSPVGLPGRAVINPFWERAEQGIYPERPHCRNCLKACTQVYCIINELEMSQEGDAKNGLVFAGESVSRIHDILSVPELMQRLITEWTAAEGAV